MTLWTELRRVREAAKLTQAAAASSLGWSQPKISDIERGLLGRLSVDDLQRLADLYKVDVGELAKLPTSAEEAAA
jgi:transcriptional regulator with XRE-family HTH domain